ncbi:MAG: hypothetical protein NTW30_02325 [Candidatus Aenigmarchaeota archaeon]|nr:hypothetical protein [Candidatus Aenigmarchaeota archaeon]
MEQKLAHEVEKLKHRVIVLEKVVTSLVEIEEFSPKNLSRQEKRHLERTLRYIREGRHDKFMGLDEFERKLNL